MHSDWNMKDTVVQVCTGNSACTPCGRVTDTPEKGVFYDMQCDEGAQGDTVLLTSESKVVYIQICEVIVYGIGKTLPIST